MNSAFQVCFPWLFRFLLSLFNIIGRLKACNPFSRIHVKDGYLHSPVVFSENSRIYVPPALTSAQTLSSSAMLSPDRPRLLPRRRSGP